MTCCDCGREIKDGEPIVAAFRHHVVGDAWQMFTGEAWHRLCDSSTGRSRSEDTYCATQEPGAK